MTTWINGFNWVVGFSPQLNKKVEQMGGKCNPEEEFQAVIMVLVMVVAFLICWSPYTIFALTVVFKPSLNISPLAATIPTYLSKTSPVYNPIIYIFLNKQVSTVWWEVLKTATPRSLHHQLCWLGFLGVAVQKHLSNLRLRTTVQY